MKDPYINLAKCTVEEYTKTGKIISLHGNLPKEMIDKKAGVFTSIHTKSGELRGCIGTFLPYHGCLGEEIIHNAISAAAQDPRFPPVTPDELPTLKYSVDILSKPKSVPDVSCLNPKTYGLIVSSSDGRRGLLLPDLEGVDTITQQIEICKQKAGIFGDEKVSFQIFTVERHEEG